MIQHARNLMTLCLVKYACHTETNVWFHFYKLLRVVTLIEAESTIVVAGCLGRRWEAVFNGYRISFLQGKKGLQMGCTIMWLCLTWLNCALQIFITVNSMFYVVHQLNSLYLKIGKMDIKKN